MRSLSCRIGGRARACALLVLSLAFAAGGVGAQQTAEAELEVLLAEERAAAARSLRLGAARDALRIVERHLDEEPEDAASRALRARARAWTGDQKGALEDSRRALKDAVPSSQARAEAVRTLAELLLERGESAEALQLLEAERPHLSVEGDARDALLLGQALWRLGRREEGRKLLQDASEADPGPTWERLLARARCERRLGHLERASRSLIAADALARAGAGAEPDVLVELGELYFEADGEVEHPEAAGRSPAVEFRRALELAPEHPGALLGLFHLHRFNWNRQSRSPGELLGELLLAHPRSVPAQLAACSADLEDGQLLSVRARLEILRQLAPARREVRTLEAALAWVEHRRDDARALLARLAEEDPLDATPELEMGRHLCELYRFAESLPFLEAAVERDPAEARAWTELGRARANTGDEAAGLEALKKAIDLAAGRQNAWRHNTARVLERIQRKYVEERARAELTFVWTPDAAEVLRTYMVPFYEEAREELAERYGFTPGPVRIEVFQSFQDFSVRSTGFEGFPALGVCFGPVVTAVSPVSELRGRFSWARTAFHEFTHVIHLGLSHNRCPRWITEGLATWEEENRNPAWTRNMRRDLVDALANRELIPVRELNRAFRGPRILFGYYQGGLLCRMLIAERGFPPMIRLLEAFDRGLDLDAALAQVYGWTPEEVDRRFGAFVRSETAELRIEPRWSRQRVHALRLSLAPGPPEDPAARQEWTDGWCSVAWGAWQQGRKVDAEEALRRLGALARTPPRAIFLRAEMALAARDREQALALYRQAVEAGGEDFRARMALGTFAMEKREWADAERHFLAAERCFPGYPEKELAAELHLAQVHAHQEKGDDAELARERWIQWNADDLPLRVQLALWHAGKDRHAEASRWFAEANEIDPFRRKLHVAWGHSLAALGRHEEALREFRVAVMVPAELDGDDSGPLADVERAELLGLQALALQALERHEEAQETARAAVALDKDCPPARRVLEKSP